MEIGLFMPTHGLGNRDEEDWFVQPTPVAELRPVAIGQRAEQLGFHSLWFGDHVTMPIAAEEPGGGAWPIQRPRKREYPPRPTMLDGAVVMGAVAANTNRIKMGPAVLIAPYRGPLNDARQYATVDVLSGGRLILGVGAGWSRGEFAALGLDFEARGRMTEECIEIYKRAWTEPVVSFQGRHYRFDNLSMDPKPVQRPRPPIIYGGFTPAAARRAVRHCDGLFPIFLDPYSDPNRYDALQDDIRREAERLQRDLAGFWMIGAQSAYLTDPGHPLAARARRRTCAGTSEQVMADLAAFADAGYGLMILHPDCPSGSVAELEEQIERIGAEVIPHGRRLRAAGEWKRAY